MKQNAHWEHFRHDADMGIRGIGTTPAKAFEQAGLAFTAIMTDLEIVNSDESVAIKCQAPSLDLLFYDWVNSLVYETSTRNMLFSKFEVDIRDDTLSAQIWGEPVDIARHQPAVEIKGATFTQLKIAKKKHHWLVQCVVDV
ncbi:MAG: archease [Pseudomonadota bacterium]